MTLKGNVSVSLTCANSEEYCFNIHYKGKAGEARQDSFTH